MSDGKEWGGLVGTGASSASRRRLRRRLVHVVALAASGLVGGGVLLRWWPDTMPRSQEVSLSFGYVSAAALVVTLLIGPLNVLLGRPNPRSNDLRRDVGLFSAVTAVAHVVFAVRHHLGGVLSLYFFSSRSPSPTDIRRDSFGLGNWLGAGALAIVVILAVTSNDLALRWLGRRWKRVQRFAYALAAATLLHALVFWQIERRDGVVRLATIAAAAVVLGAQARGFVAMRRRQQ